MATLNLQVNANSDDASRRLTSSAWYLSSTDSFAGCYNASTYQYGTGMRFQNVTIPQGATITEAHLVLTCKDSYSGTTVNTRISAEDVDDASTFADNSSAFDTRWAARTTARVDWDSISAWTGGTEYNSPDIKTVIQEITDRAGWSSGNDIVIFWDDFEDRSSHASNALRSIYTYEGSSTYAPKISITYEVNFVPKVIII